MCSEFALSSLVNLLRVVIHFWKCNESLHFALIYYMLSNESLCVVNSLQSGKHYGIDSIPKTVQEGLLGHLHAYNDFEKDGMQTPIQAWAKQYACKCIPPTVGCARTASRRLLLNLLLNLLLDLLTDARCASLRMTPASNFSKGASPSAWRWSENAQTSTKSQRGHALWLWQPATVRARKRHINFEHINFLKVGTTLGQPAG